MVARPVIPTAPPPRDEGYDSGSPPTTAANTRGVTRPHSVSPFLRSVRARTEQEEQDDDLEAVTSLLDFSARGRREPRPPTPAPQVTVSSFLIEKTSGSSTATTSVMVRTFSTSPPATPAAAPRPDHPPPVISARRSGHLVRPRPLRRNLQEEEERLRGMSHTCHACSRPNSAASAALGAPPGQEEEESLELSDMAETPASPATSDITVIRLVENFLGKIIFKKKNIFYVTYDCFLFFSSASSPIIIPLFSDDEEFYSELEYVDPNEGEGPFSTTPPPSCDRTKDHEVCVPPAWGERIPGSIVSCRCVLCHEDDSHHAIRCIQCMNAPGCCRCIWDYMRSRYNSGCPLCRAGDPEGENPLGEDRRRVAVVRPRERHQMVLRRRTRGRGCRGGRGERRSSSLPEALHCGIGRGTTIEGQDEKREDEKREEEKKEEEKE